VSAPAVLTRGLGKSYGRVRALEDLSLSVEEGEVFGFLGPNGAGKTTTIRLLLGLLRPDAGEAELLGRRVVAGRTAPHPEVGYLPGELALWPWYTGEITLDFLASLAGRPPLDRTMLLERLQLEERDLARPVAGYSDGMKQKLGIVLVLQCRPRLVLLDEPTKGLDPLMQQAFYQVLGELREKGLTVFFSSHVLSEVERVCDRVAMLRAGRLVKVGAVADLERLQKRRVAVVFTEDVDGTSLARFGEVIETDTRRLVMLVPQAELPALITRLGMLPLADLVVEPPSLEDFFLELYR
jgi:ABC-2 type transport system ATP-binding protein